MKLVEGMAVTRGSETAETEASKKFCHQRLRLSVMKNLGTDFLSEEAVAAETHTYLEKELHLKKTEQAKKI